MKGAESVTAVLCPRMSTASSAALPRRTVLADAIPGALARDIALVIGGAVFMALMAQVTIKMPGELVPITGQTLGVGLIGATLGSRRGVSAMSLYAVRGPVPAGLRGRRQRLGRDLGRQRRLHRSASSWPPT